jgi:hypothetical protein
MRRRILLDIPVVDALVSQSILDPQWAWGANLKAVRHAGLGEAVSRNVLGLGREVSNALAAATKPNNLFHVSQLPLYDYSY